MKAVIFAAGKGKRLEPITNTMPKPMVPVCGKPLLEWIIGSLRYAGIRDFLLVVGYLKEKITSHFGDGKRFGVDISYVEQAEPKGTAHALGFAGEFIGKDKKFLLVYGDVLFERNLIKDFLASCKGKSAICSKQVQNPERFGVFELDGNKIIKIHEKSDNPPSNWINAGIYILPNKIFRAIEKTIPSRRNEYELTDSIQILIDEGHEFLHFPIKGFWSDVGDIATLEMVRRSFRCVE